jgi:hypothetical protein
MNILKVTGKMFFQTPENFLSAGAAWYVKDREAFVRDPVELVVGELARSAAVEGLHVEKDQQEEWHSSIGVLQRERSAGSGSLRY